MLLLMMMMMMMMMMMRMMMMRMRIRTSAKWESAIVGYVSGMCHACVTHVLVGVPCRRRYCFGSWQLYCIVFGLWQL